MAILAMLMTVWEISIRPFNIITNILTLPKNWRRGVKRGVLMAILATPTEARVIP